VVELAVAVVLGTAFTDLIASATKVGFTTPTGRPGRLAAVAVATCVTRLTASVCVAQDFITPLIAAIFAGSNFAELSFYINGSQFAYG
jgi:large-conductance mechanosensitive channel